MSYRVVCVSHDHTQLGGGVPAVVDQLLRHVAAHGTPVGLLGVGNVGIPVQDIPVTHIVPSRLGRMWGWSPKLTAGISAIAVSPERAVFHIHGVWAAAQYIAAKAARQHSVPFILSTHGMLEPWLWKSQGWPIRLKKEIYWRTMAYPAFRNAKIVHAITPREAKHLQTLFPTNRIAVIPNAIDVNRYPDKPYTDERQRLIVFLGRIEPVKGVDILLQAFAAARLSRDWRVAIIGPVGSRAYQKKLERIVAEHQLRERVSFVGPAFDEEKVGWLRRAWVLAAPSHSEVIGLVNLEAAVNRLPSITTHQTGLYDWESGGGVLIEPIVTQMKNALERVCSWDDAERTERGIASYKLVADRYSWKSVLPMWISLYDSLSGKTAE